MLYYSEQRHSLPNRRHSLPPHEKVMREIDFRHLFADKLIARLHNQAIK